MTAIIDNIKRQPIDGISALAVKFNRFKGQAVINKFCRNPDVDGPEDIWNGGGIYTGFPLTAAEEFQVLSSSAADTITGTGARVVRVFYYDADFNMFDADGNYLYFDVNMNGTTAVNSGITGIRVWRSKVILSGSGGQSAGDITVRWRTTTAVVFAVMPLGFSQTQIGNFTIPNGYRGVLTQYGATMFDNNANRAEICIKVRDFGSNTFSFSRPFAITTEKNGFFDMYGGDLYEAKTDICMRCLSVANTNANISGQYAIHLVKDGIL